jgi:hypothetical protein
MASNGLETKWSVADIQKAIVVRTGNDQSIPNVSFGFFKHIECDLVQVTGAAYVYEYEIKRSWGDFMADFKKSHFHDDLRISKLIFVLPESFAGERLKKFCQENYQKFKREFSFLFYMEDGNWCRLAEPTLHQIDEWRSEYRVDDRFKTETYITEEMLKVIRKNDHDAPYRRHLFVEELAQLYRLGVIRLWHRTSHAEKAAQDGEQQEDEQNACF